MTGDSITVHSYKNIPFSDKGLWQSGDHTNRTWQFSLHSFAPLDCLMATGNIDHATALVQDWIALHGIKPSGKLRIFPWHDHATALRLDRLSLLELSTGCGRFQNMAQTHAELLLRDDFYSKNTNHGYDQALSLILAAYTFAPHLETGHWMQTGLDRLGDEIAFAFNPEGVHVENSPSYHVGMVANLVRGRLVLDRTGQSLKIDFDALLDRALLFTAWIIGPDRTVAMFGDSTRRGGSPPAELAHLPHYQSALYACTAGTQGSPPEGQFAVYENAGYGFYRASWDAKGWKDHVYLTMKCGFLSSYHRQDDDLGILLDGFGEAWLIDSGLYNHNQKDPKRQYMRSALAHNLPFIQGSSVSRSLPPAHLRPTLGALTQPDGTVCGFTATTRMYKGATLTRRIEVQSPQAFQISDSFRMTSPNGQKFCLFHVPANKTVRTSPHFARIVGKDMELIIRVGAGTVRGCRVYRGDHPQFPSMTSNAINHIEDTQVIVFGPVESDTVRFTLSFAQRPV